MQREALGVPLDGELSPRSPPYPDNPIRGPIVWFPVTSISQSFSSSTSHLCLQSWRRPAPSTVSPAALPWDGTGGQGHWEQFPQPSSSQAQVGQRGEPRLLWSQSHRDLTWTWLCHSSPGFVWGKSLSLPESEFLCL